MPVSRENAPCAGGARVEAGEGDLRRLEESDRVLGRHAAAVFAGSNSIAIATVCGPTDHRHHLRLHITGLTFINLYIGLRWARSVRLNSQSKPKEKAARDEGQRADRPRDALSVPAARVLQHERTAQVENTATSADVVKEDFEKLDENPIEGELHIYTWPDATLREIADLVQDSNSDARKSSARMGFSIVSQIRDGRIVMRKIGWVNSNRRKTGDEDKTLAALRFEPGDYLDVALHQ